MGSLGDKFKKLAGDQTRQLLQNFQNAQSSKSKNGYSYGKLNEDGTATLADGTTVQVEVKGRPGQYAPVFNLGNGQGLVDQPEAKFFTVDSSRGVKSYIIRANLYQKYPISIYQDQAIAGGTVEGGAIYYFNLIDFSSITLMDRITEEIYTVDPTTYSGLASLPMPSLSVKAFSSEQYSRFFGSGLNLVNLRPIPAPPDVNQLAYAYSGAYVMFGAEGKDILIYQTSTYNILNDYFLDEFSRTYTDQADTGSLFFSYWILKDFYFEDGLVKASQVIQGQYIPDSVPLTLRSSTGGLVTFIANGVFSTNNTQYTPYLSRDENDEPRLDLLVASRAYYQLSVTVPAGFIYDYTLTEYVGSQQYFVKGVNTTQETTWKEIYSTQDYPMTSFSGAYTSGGLIYGFGTADDRVTYYRLNTETYAPGSVVPGLDLPSFPVKGRILLSSTTTYQEDTLDLLYESIGTTSTGGDYSSAQSPSSSTSVNFSIRLPIAGLNSTDTTWTGIYVSEDKIRFVRYYLSDEELTYTRLSGSKDYTTWFSYVSAPYTLELFDGPIVVYDHPTASITI